MTGVGAGAAPGDRARRHLLRHRRHLRRRADHGPRPRLAGRAPGPGHEVGQHHRRGPAGAHRHRPQPRVRAPGPAGLAAAAGHERRGRGLLHLHDLDPVLAEDLVAVCEDLVDVGSLRACARRIDGPARAALLARGPHCAAVEHQLDVLDDDPVMLALCEAQGLASVVRSPLAMGLLTGRVGAGTLIPPGDIRHDQPPWLLWLDGGRPAPEHLARRDAGPELLAGDGRTLAQGALARVSPSRCPSRGPPRPRRSRKHRGHGARAAHPRAVRRRGGGAASGAGRRA